MLPYILNLNSTRFRPAASPIKCLISSSDENGGLFTPAAPDRDAQA
jgi:hypothetical protein